LQTDIPLSDSRILKEFCTPRMKSVFRETDLSLAGTLFVRGVSNLSDTPRASRRKIMAMSMAVGGVSAPQMNVTPLIDVLLVLIIIFMVIVAESKEKGLEAQIPQPASQVDTPQPIGRTIVIQLADAQSGDLPVLKINRQELGWPDLKAKLQDIFKQRAEKIAFVQGEDNVDFEYVADVIDTARDAGAARVGLLPREMAAAR
jgi:biopolymer transport protein ExbD